MCQPHVRQPRSAVVCRGFSYVVDVGASSKHKGASEVTSELRGQHLSAKLTVATSDEQKAGPGYRSTKHKGASEDTSDLRGQRLSAKLTVATSVEQKAGPGCRST